MGKFYSSAFPHGILLYRPCARPRRVACSFKNIRAISYAKCKLCWMAGASSRQGGKWVPQGYDPGSLWITLKRASKRRGVRARCVGTVCIKFNGEDCGWNFNSTLIKPPRGVPARLATTSMLDGDYGVSLKISRVCYVGRYGAEYICFINRIATNIL